jgi:hypothetical protein
MDTIIRVGLISFTALVGCGAVVTAATDESSAAGDTGGGGSAANADPGSCPASAPAPNRTTECDTVGVECEYSEAPCGGRFVCADAYWDNGEEIPQQWDRVEPTDGDACFDPGESCTFSWTDWQDEASSVSTHLCTDDGWASASTFCLGGGGCFPYCPAELPAEGDACEPATERDDHVFYEQCAYAFTTPCGVHMATLVCDDGAFVVNVPPC